MKHVKAAYLLFAFLWLSAPFAQAGGEAYPQLLTQAADLVRAGKWDAAEVQYLKIIKSPDVRERIEAYEGLVSLYKKVRVYKKAERAEVSLKREKEFQSLLVPSAASFYKPYKVEKGDTYGKIAAKHGVSLKWLMEANESRTLKAGDTIRLPDLRDVIEIDKKNRRLYWKRGDGLLKSYPVTIGGSESESPDGEFKIVTKIKDPTWYWKQKVIPADSPKNLLGTRWLGLDRKGYGIHGTRDPKSIGEATSHGCIRMHNRDVEELFSWISVGTRVLIHSGKLAN